jgi:ABC-2 type transport system ATP-binding protein
VLSWQIDDAVTQISRSTRDCAIETRGLSRRFGPTVAVADLTLSIPRGEIFGFLGPNGAGKTTSVKMLLALVAPSGGAGTVLGAPIGDRETRRRVGFLPEHFRFHDVLSGRELLQFHGRLYGLRGAVLDRRIDELLHRVDLFDAAQRPLREYSKGMLQRIGLAQALINRPALVFLDEPTSGLDPLGRLLVRDLLRELRAEGTTVFLNSHLLGEVEATCDRVAFVKAGRTVHERSLSAGTSDVEVELRVGPAAAPLVPRLAEFGTHIVEESGRIRMRVASEEMLPAIVRWLVAGGVDVYEVRSRRQSLEQLFLEVMGRDQRPG